MEKDCNNKMKHVGDIGDMSIYEFAPCILQPLAVPLEPLSLVRKTRFLLDYLRGGYKVYYIAKEDFVLGYCVITPGGRRLKCSTNKDVVIGPYYIRPEYRGQGLSKLLVEKSLEHCTYSYETVYDWIHEGNIPSIRCMESCGFKHIGNLDVIGTFRRLVNNPHGAYLVFSRHNTHNE